MLKTFDIYFDDLTSESQVQLLNEFDTREDDENWDAFPIAVIDREMDES